MKNKKKIDFGDVIHSMNTSLCKSQAEIFCDNKDDQISIHVVGAPRSGTTLLIQLLLTHLNVGYINNLIAAFYKSPVYGIRLSQQLLGDNYTSQMTSEFGRTNNIQEPHEFSYFWKMHLNYSDFLQRTYKKNHSVNWSELKQALHQITLAFDKPVVYKSFQYGFHAMDAVKHMPKSIFIHIERDLYQNAYSILKLRREQNHNEDHWASIKPVQYQLLKNENKYRQIIGQVLCLNLEYRKQLIALPEQNKLFIRYGDLCNYTEDILKEVSQKISQHEPLPHSSKSVINLKENKSELPQELQLQFEDAEIWVRKTFPELKSYNV